MKKLKHLSLLLTLLCFTLSVFAQENNDKQQFVIYEYKVKPDMIQQSEQFDKNLIQLLDEHNCSGPNWMTAQTMDGRFLYIEPINSMADLDKNDFMELANKMGKEEMEKMWEKSYAYEDNYTSYLIALDKSLTYMPAGLDIMTPGEEFRRWDYYYLKPGKRAKAEEVAKAIKQMFEEKQSKVGYRVYHSGLGTDRPFMMVASSAKSMADHSQKIIANNELMGPEFEKLYQELLTNCEEVDHHYGRMRPDLSRNPAAIARVD